MEVDVVEFAAALVVECVISEISQLHDLTNN